MKKEQIISKAKDGILEVGELYTYLEDEEYFTSEELNLVTNVAGYSIETLNNCLYSRYGVNDILQLLEE